MIKRAGWNAFELTSAKAVPPLACACGVVGVDGREFEDTGT